MGLESIALEPIAGVTRPDGMTNDPLVTGQVDAGPIADAALHVANRLAWGPTPDLLTEIRQLGPSAWIEQQLDPARIDDSALERDLAGLFPELDREPRELDAMDMHQGDLRRALRVATLLRAVRSERQLFETVVAFWSMHFSLRLDGGAITYTKPWEDREVIRKHALGRFEDLLLADAQSPAMLTYLDQRRSKAPDVNENYARELLELHTLGVDGGYTEVDVRQAAYALSGWTVDRDSHLFFFNPGRHDERRLQVLDWTAPAGNGVERGESLIRYLANHPQTARYVSRRLATWFIGPDASDDLVQRAADVFLRTGTDITATLRVLLHSDEFAASAGAKLHRPFGALAKALRATDATIDLAGGATSEGARRLEHLLRRVGQLPFGWPTPDGYPDEIGHWVAPAPMVQRLNAYSRLAHNKERGITIDHDRLIPTAATAGELVDRLGVRLLGRAPNGRERDELIAFLGGETTPMWDIGSERARHTVALLLSLPSAQRR